ncbi:hypothetical protein BLA24_18885 [Streptomyces cinnamoneus]|uniref:Uncharacterized protein n=1 Tax=Streptomyces cinnamoneus TaxID=53446 RepID=A0A2G1XHX9_STRCJ|nr:sterol carrier family protein [Streptomyces cinnamoneus]PHQ50827.1 hypothetical protein BLA24_18885 [Streptomyces cinnamoneus]PPT13915.1 maleylpyruvate isomerase family mycothiol-dependent enzyme [Streptomyces cinnamoneus]
MAPRPRTYHHTKTRAAVTAQLQNLRAAVEALGEEQFGLPTGVDGRTVSELVAATAETVALVDRYLEQPAPPAREITATEWPSTTRPAAGEPAAETAAAAATDPRAPLGRAASRFAELTAVAPADRLLATPFGAMRLDDFLVTRCVELVVHTDDLATALGVEIPYDRQALATATRLLADALAARAPGGSVEVRIPPFAVVQCVEGPRHTRGTPPNVVETDPLTWIRLAAGRIEWSDAVERASVTASGERADISAQLPLLG